MKPFVAVKVYRWKNASEKELISLNAFQDDNREDAIHKLANSIQPDTSFYAWSNDKSLLFSIKDAKWKGYNVNPFKANDYESKELLEPVSYEYHLNMLFMHKVIHIAFESDLPAVLRKNKYYFPNLKKQTAQQYKKRNDKLLKLYDQNAKNVQILPEYYTRANFHGMLNNVSLPVIFDDIHTSKHIDMIQWIDDTSKILYKIYKKHKIHREHFGMWTNVAKITKINVINIYSIVNRNSFCKISIDHEGNILFNYVLDHRKYIQWKEIHEHKIKIISILQNVLKTGIKLVEISMNINFKLQVQNSTLKLLSKNISEAIDILHILSNKAISITCTYKRSSNYSQNTDIYDYIKSRINLGISKQEILDELNNLGVSGNLEEIVNDEFEMMNGANVENQPLQIKLQDNGTIIIIKPYSQGYDINVINCPNNVEFQYLVCWLTRIVSMSVGKVLPITQKAVVQPSPPSVESPKSSKSSDSSVSVDDGSIDFDDLDSLGGAPSKNNNFINLLQQADKDLFAENYAREKCQNHSQPVVLSKDQKENLENTNQMHFDNIIEYGSKPSNMNHYACPRLWCPQSKVPLSVDDANAKCPLENEIPMQLFWDNDKNKKRYVKLIKPNDKGMCVPCCMKKEPKANDTGKCMAYLQKSDDKQDMPLAKLQNDNVEIIENDENYIMNQIAPIPVGRYGNIPGYLSKILDIKPDSCYKVLTKMHSCFVRKGVKNSKTDSIIHSIMEILDFKTKAEFIKDVKKKLDLYTFVSLADGMICKQFMSMREIVPENNIALVKEYNASKLSAFKEGNLSRTLNIYYAYKRYMDYLSCKDFTAMKNPYYLYSLVSSLYDIYILVWEKIDKTNDIYFNCFHTILDFNPSVAMIIREGMYYEPVEVKTRGATGSKTFKLNDYPKLRNIVTQCNKQNTDVRTYTKLNILHNWVRSKLLKKWKNYDIKYVLINNDLSINSFLTSGNIMLEFHTMKISFLPNIMKDFGIDADNIRFYDDMVDKNQNVNILKEDFALFAQKCQELDINIRIGNIKKENTLEYYSSYMLPEKHLTNSMIIHTNDKNEYYNSHANMQHKSKKWYELQKMVATTIIKNYIKVHNVYSNRKDKVEHLLTLFAKMPATEMKKVKLILEEIPVESVQSVKTWLSNLIIHSKYDYYSSTPVEHKDEYTFSQNAILQTIPDYMLIYHKALPNVRTKQEDEVNVVLHDTSPVQPVNNMPVSPAIFKGDAHALKTKWIMHKKSRWNNMIYIKCAYTKDTIPEFILWFMKRIDISGISYQDIQKLVKQKYVDIMNDKEIFLDILQDPWYFDQWAKKAGKKFGSTQQFWETYYVHLSQQDRVRYTTSIRDNDMSFANDLHIMAISELLNISILLIHRGKYGKFESGNARGEVDDLKGSSTLFAAKRNLATRPLLIFHKTYEKHNIVYNIIVDKNIQNSMEAVYLKYDDVPANIKVLTDAHLSDIL
jgi:hypothetical protein